MKRLTLLVCGTGLTLALAGCTLTNPDRPHGPPTIQQPNARELPQQLDKMLASAARLTDDAEKADWNDARDELGRFSAAWMALNRVTGSANGVSQANGGTPAAPQTSPKADEAVNNSDQRLNATDNSAGRVTPLRSDVVAPPSVSSFLDQNLRLLNAAVANRQKTLAERSAIALYGSVEAYAASHLSIGSSSMRELKYFARQMDLDASMGDWNAVRSAMVSMQFMWSRIYSSARGLSKGDAERIDNNLSTLVGLLDKQNAALLHDAVVDLDKSVDRLIVKLTL